MARSSAKAGSSALSCLISSAMARLGNKNCQCEIGVAGKELAATWVTAQNMYHLMLGKRKNERKKQRKARLAG